MSGRFICFVLESNVLEIQIINFGSLETSSFLFIRDVYENDCGVAAVVIWTPQFVKLNNGFFRRQLCNWWKEQKIN